MVRGGGGKVVVVVVVVEEVVFRCRCTTIISTYGVPSMYYTYSLVPSPTPSFSLLTVH